MKERTKIVKLKVTYKENIITSPENWNWNSMIDILFINAGIHIEVIGGE